MRTTQIYIGTFGNPEDIKITENYLIYIYPLELEHGILLLLNWEVCHWFCL